MDRRRHHTTRCQALSISHCLIVYLLPVGPQPVKVAYCCNVWVMSHGTDKREIFPTSGGKVMHHTSIFSGFYLFEFKHTMLMV